MRIPVKRVRCLIDWYSRSDECRSKSVWTGPIPSEVGKKLLHLDKGGDRI